jgi:hypothetical protein
MVLNPLGALRLYDQIEAFVLLRGGAPPEIVAEMIFERMKIRDPLWRSAFERARFMALPYILEKST